MFPTAAGKLGKNFGYGMSISLILSSIAFTICIFFYLYIIGSFFEITIYPLVNRVTSNAVFEEHLVNEYLDNVIVIAATTSWFLLSANNRTIRYSISLAYGATGTLFAVISPDNIIFDVLALLSLPLILGVALYHYKQQQKKKQILYSNAKLTLRYISMAVIAISAIGIVFPALSVFLGLNLDAFSRNSPATNCTCC